jgi:hypothetical protein
LLVSTIFCTFSNEIKRILDNYPEFQIVQIGCSSTNDCTDKVCATFVFIIGENPTYDIIENGAWIDNERPYGTIHYIASNRQVTGVFDLVLDWCTAHCKNIRIDTHQDNRRMIHLIEKAGFSRCGIIYTRDHFPRIAYQMIVST